MTRKDYILVSDAVSSVTKSYHEWAISNVTREVVDAIADALAEDNPNFDRERFIVACYKDMPRA